MASAFPAGLGMVGVVVAIAKRSFAYLNDLLPLVLVLASLALLREQAIWIPFLSLPAGVALQFVVARVQPLSNETVGSS